MDGHYSTNYQRFRRRATKEGIFVEEVLGRRVGA
jgi:hypothetical protein